MIHDEPGAPLAGQIGPSPLQEDTQAEAGCSQKLEVNESPPPRHQSARLDPEYRASAPSLNSKAQLVYHHDGPFFRAASFIPANIRTIDRVLAPFLSCKAATSDR